MQVRERHFRKKKGETSWIFYSFSLMNGTKVFWYLEVTQRMEGKTGMGSETAQGSRNLDGEWRLGKILAVWGFVIAFSEKRRHNDTLLCSRVSKLAFFGAESKAPCLLFKLFARLFFGLTQFCLILHKRCQVPNWTSIFRMRVDKRWVNP